MSSSLLQSMALASTTNDMQEWIFTKDASYTNHYHFPNPHRKTQEIWSGCSRESNRQASVPHQAGEPTEE